MGRTPSLLIWGASDNERQWVDVLSRVFLASDLEAGFQPIVANDQEVPPCFRIRPWMITALTSFCCALIPAACRTWFPNNLT